MRGPCAEQPTLTTAFDKRVEHLALPDLADNSLRVPTTQELLAADRKIWGTISALVASGWSLDEALYEVTSVRSALSNLLQPRPKPQLTLQPTDKGKGKGQGTSGKSKAEDRRSDWVLKAHGKVLCKRYERNLCQLPNCKFAHLCAVRGCGKDHYAVDDKKAS